jgi:hypothetical protein
MMRIHLPILVTAVLGCSPGAVEAPLRLDSGAEPEADGGVIPPVKETPRSLLPLAIGNLWEYRVTDPLSLSPTSKVSRVVGQSPMSGAKSSVTAFVIESTTGASRSRVFVEPRPGFALRHREEEYRANALAEWKVFTPGALRGPTDLPALGQTFSEAFSEEVHAPDGSLKKTKGEAYVWTVERLDEAVTVPAGTFSAVRLRRKKTDSAKEKVTWWAPGVGKVKESAEELEELVRFHVQ